VRADGDSADSVLEAVKKTKYGSDANIIGEVRESHPSMVLLRTVVGGTLLFDIVKS